jgi:uncharacterized membrane protein
MSGFYAVTLRTLMLLALIAWIGGIVFFSFVLAPTLFTVLPSREMAGNVVSHSLTSLHWIGLISGVVFLVCSLAYNQRTLARLKPFAAAHVFVVLMLALTMVSQFGITPRMRTLRAQLADAQAWHDSDQTEFLVMHKLSTWTEGTVCFFGLAVVVLTSRRDQAPH